ncbi:MAG: sigma-70 family RNA polymerase sigma factor [Anaerolineales bacterium]
MDARAGSNNSEEQAWITNAQHGDRQAFAELVRRHRPGVVNVVYQMCGDPGVAEDAAQEAFLRAWQNLGRYSPRFAFRSWVYRIALNVAVDSLRRERPAVPLLEAESLASGSEGPEALLERKQQAEQVQRAVLHLPPASRAVLVLREYEALSYHEIAEALDIPVGTVMSRLNYARGQLRQALGRQPEAR